MALWYYTVNGQQFGPVDEAQVRSLMASGQVRPQEMVWTEGMPAWQPAGQALGPPIIAQAAVPVVQPAYAGGQQGAPIALQYELPTNPAPVIAPDTGPFFKLGGMFSLPGNKRWTGVSVVSPRAFYLLKIRRQGSSVGYGVGGIAGMLIASALTKADDTRTCDLNDLPPHIRFALDPKGKRKKGDVIVLPKEAIRLVKLGGGLNCMVAVDVGAEKFRINRSLFAGDKVRQFLAGTGWVVNQEVIATAAPIHGPGFGRPFSELGKQGASTLKRVLLIVLAIVIILIVILLSALR